VVHSLIPTESFLITPQCLHLKHDRRSTIHRHHLPHKSRDHPLKRLTTTRKIGIQWTVKIIWCDDRVVCSYFQHVFRGLGGAAVDGEGEVGRSVVRQTEMLVLKLASISRVLTRLGRLAAGWFWILPGGLVVRRWGFVDSRGWGMRMFGDIVRVGESNLLCSHTFLVFV